MVTVTTVPAFTSGTNSSQPGPQVGVKIQLASDGSGAYVPVVALDPEAEIAIGSVSQEGAWTVQANAGSNLNTSALALERGGNLATLAGTVLVGRVQTTVATELPAGTNSIGGTYAAPTASSSFAITPGSSSSLEAGHVLKSSAGNLYSIYMLTTSVAGYLMTFDATSIPGDGAVTPVECIPVFDGNYVQIDFSGSPPDYYSSGIVAVFSTTGPLTLTKSATAFFKWRVQ